MDINNFFNILYTSICLLCKRRLILDLFSTAGAKFCILEFFKRAPLIVWGVEHGGVFTEDPLLGNKWVSVRSLLVIIVVVQTRWQNGVCRNIKFNDLHYYAKAACISYWGKKAILSWSSNSSKTDINIYVPLLCSCKWVLNISFIILHILVEYQDFIPLIFLLKWH